MANTRNGVPAGWHWRDGRPRWIPSPTLRRAGWSGRDLKDGRGLWLARGPSIAAADALVQAVDAWRAGRPVPADLAGSAPAGAEGPSAHPAPGSIRGQDPFSIGALMDAYLASDEARQLAPATLADYRRKLKRLADALAGYARLPDLPKEAEAYARAVAAIRAAPVFVLEPEEGPAGLTDLLHAAYWKLHEHAGVHMAAGVMAAAGAWLSWCRRRRSRKIHNWAADVARETPAGRIRVLSWPEIAALVAAAERLNVPAVADALILAVDLAWSECDVLALTWADVRKVDGRRVALGARQKTGRVGGTPFLGLGLRRLALIKARQRRMAAQPLKVIHLARQRRHGRLRPEAEADYFRGLFARVRAEAAKQCPSVADATFADTRDTGFSLGKAAGLTDDGIVSRTRQSRKNVAHLGDRHYGQVGPATAQAAADQLDAYVERDLKRAGVKL